MNAILGWLTLLAKGDGVKDSKRAIAVIQRNAQLQARLIDDLLEMNRLASGTVRLEIAALDIESALTSAVDALRPTAEAKSVHLSLTIEPGLPQIQCDGRRIQQILWNVLQNAVKFTGTGGTVDAVVQQVDGRICIVVKDTGRGIAADFLPHIFERFRQEDQSTTREASGLGIGLSIAKYLVELHGGSIHAASPGVNQGATFVVELPILASNVISGGEDKDGLSAARIG
jgi:signal transduction histidine kinase